jgi:hypothetical protein
LVCILGRETSNSLRIKKKMEDKMDKGRRKMEGQAMML